VGASWAQDGPIYQLTGLTPLFAAFDGPLLALTDDRELLEAMLARRTLVAGESPAAEIAEWRRNGFDASFEALFSRLSISPPAATADPAESRTCSPRTSRA